MNYLACFSYVCKSCFFISENLYYLSLNVSPLYILSNGISLQEHVLLFCWQVDTHPAFFQLRKLGSSHVVYAVLNLSFILSDIYSVCTLLSLDAYILCRLSFCNVLFYIFPRLSSLYLIHFFIFSIIFRFYYFLPSWFPYFFVPADSWYLQSSLPEIFDNIVPSIHIRLWVVLFRVCYFYVINVFYDWHVLTVKQKLYPEGLMNLSIIRPGQTV